MISKIIEPIKNYLNYKKMQMFTGIISWNLRDEKVLKLFCSWLGGRHLVAFKCLVVLSL
jgi:hypothetical protein